MSGIRRLAVIGTDTGVGKTTVVRALVTGARRQGTQVWLHKPVACGGWDGVSSEDGRDLRALCGDGQDPATVCPREFPEPCSPHLAARAAGAALRLEDLVAAASSLRPPASSLLILETAGGLLAPITSDRLTNADLLAALGWPVLLVARPHLGTLNHTQLTVNEARRRGLRVLGLVLNRHEPVNPGLAVDSAAGELALLTGLPILADLPYGVCEADAVRLAVALAGIN